MTPSYQEMESPANSGRFGEDVTSILHKIVTAEGDTVLFELTNELTQAQLRLDTAELRVAAMREADPCAQEMRALVKAAIEVGSSAILLALNAIPGGVFAKALVAMVIGGYGAGADNLPGMAREATGTFRRVLNGIGAAGLIYGTWNAGWAAYDFYECRQEHPLN